MDISYNIHNLIGIKIIQHSENISKSLDFNIANFKTTDDISHLPNQILVKPFSELPRIGKPLETFHLFSGRQGQYLIDEENKMAYSKTANGFGVYTDHTFFVTLFIQFLLADNKKTLVHAAAVSDQEGNCILFPGPGGVGKTALLGYLVKERGFKLLGDDLIILSNDRHCLSFPRSFVLKKYHKDIYPEVFKKLKVNKGKKLKPVVTKFLYQNAPLVGITKTLFGKLGVYNKIRNNLPLPRDYEATVPVVEIFGTDSVTNKAKLKKIYFLERYNGDNISIEYIDELSLKKRMFNIIHHEWHSIMKLFYSLGALGLADTEQYFKDVSEVLSNGIEGINAEIIKIPNNTPPGELSDYFKKLIK